MVGACGRAGIPPDRRWRHPAWRSDWARRIGLAIAISLAVLQREPAAARVLSARPRGLHKVLRDVRPGDTVQLEAGTYETGLPVKNLVGRPDAPIVITGPKSGARAVFVARKRNNTVSIVDSAYVEIRNLELDGRGLNADAVKAEGNAHWAHHITLDNLLIYGHARDQQIVGISTKCAAWGWVIRNCVIKGAGTGMYFGGSKGDAGFFDAVIEHNVIVDTIGYNIEIKEQRSRPVLPEAPTGAATTIIRHNIFSKANGGSGGKNARPNVLVGHWPLAGPGSTDRYLIYGNFFYQNPNDESLFQGEGDIALYDNLFINDFGDAVQIHPHKGPVREIAVFHNTVIARGVGVRAVRGEAGYRQQIVANAVFAGQPLEGGSARENATYTFDAAPRYLLAPRAPIGALDLYPKEGTLAGGKVDGLPACPDAERDFNGAQRTRAFRGAYAGEGKNPGWRLALDRKPPP